MVEFTKVLLSFFVPATASVVAFSLAYVSRGLPAEQYTHVDDILMSTLDSMKSRLYTFLGWTPLPMPPRNNSLSGYQIFLLALSDQLLVTGVGLLISLYSQMCSLSAFSFNVVVNVVFLCQTVHLVTLTALRAHFIRNPKPAKLRVWILLVFLVLLYVTIFLQYITATYDSYHLAACEIRYFQENLGFAVWDWGTWAWATFISYYSSITRHLFPTGPDSWTMALLSVLFAGPHSHQVLGDFLAEEKRKGLEKNAEKHQALVTLTQNTGPGKSFRLHILGRFILVLGPEILGELIASMAYELADALFWYGWGTYWLVDVLFFNNPDLSPLLEMKFGQVMPLILLLVYAIAAAEAGVSDDTRANSSIVSEIDLNSRRASTIYTTDATPITEPPERNASQPSIPMPVLRRRTFGLTTQGMAQAEPPNTISTELRSIQSRTSTVQLERAQSHCTLQTQDDGELIDVFALARQEAGLYINISVLIFFFLLVGYLLLVAFYMRYTVTTLATVFSVRFVIKTGTAVRTVRRLKRERQRCYGGGAN
ncbi:hypothetical protein B0T22DRAFT_378487 [Podospora appendiculata]|uniref:Uncharacterized protein n=1 Tax=Podospora appendiculata TaxID=314037 RepID=A0AAE0XD44_9PEZI|nr:hypothetical protein B0T22DRAFT_378487 [Podospora appendiculata]